MNKILKNCSIVEIITFIVTAVAITIQICRYLFISITLNFAYNLDINLIKPDFWDTLFQFLYNIFISIPLLIAMLIILVQIYHKKNNQKEKTLIKKECTNQIKTSNNNKIFNNKKTTYFIIIIICTSLFVYLNHIVDFNNGKSLITNITLLIINDFVIYIILWGILLFATWLLKKDYEDNLAFIKDEIKTEKNEIIIILIMGGIFGIIVYLSVACTFNILNEVYNRTNYLILDENTTFISTDKIETDVILYQTNDYIIVSDCVIDLKSEKITIYKSTSEILKNRNVHTTISNFKKKEIKQKNSFDQLKRK